MRAQNLITDAEFLAQKTKLNDQRAALGYPNSGRITVDQVKANIAEIRYFALIQSA